MLDENISSKEFIKETADNIFSNMMEDEDKQYLCEHDDPFEYHFSLGMAIRNSCIYPYLAFNKFTDGKHDPDDLSHDIMIELIRMAKAEKKR